MSECSDVRSVTGPEIKIDFRVDPFLNESSSDCTTNRSKSSSHSKRGLPESKKN